MSTAPLAPVRRGALLGLLAGLLVGGLALFGVGLLRVLRPVDCAALPAAECALEQEIAQSFGRRQVFAGGALALLGGALFVLTRRRSPP